MVSLIDTMITWFYVVWFPMCIAQTYYTTITSSIQFDNLTSSITCAMQHWYESMATGKLDLEDYGPLLSIPSAFNLVKLGFVS